MTGWRLAFFVLILLTGIFGIVNIFYKPDVQEIDLAKNENEQIIEYKANQTIRVKFSKSGEIVAMDINDYLRGVVPSEMSPTYEIEALKAQALVARTYTYRKIESGGEGQDADMCDSYAHCQAFYTKEKLFEIWARKGYTEKEILDFWNRINEAVVATQNEIITYNGKCIKAFFHASSPERTEDISQIWGGENLPYLKSVENTEDENYANRTSQVRVSFVKFLNELQNNFEEFKNIDEENVINTRICDYTISGRVKNIEVCGIKVSAEKLRTIFGLKSTNFTIEITDEELIFNVIGYGHGVGMSQVGANYLAKNGMKYDQIIKYYYTGVKIEKLT